MTNDEAKGFFGIGLLTVVIVVFVFLLIIALNFGWLGFRPAFLDIQREQDVHSRQNVAGQQQIISDDIADYSKLDRDIANLQSQPQSEARDNQIKQDRAAQAVDVQNAHDQANNVADISVLPKSQQDWLNTHR